MTLRPGVRFVWLLAVIVAWSVVSVVWPATSWLIWMALLVLGGAAVFEYLTVTKALRRIDIRRRVPPVVGRDRRFSVTLEILNGSGRAWSALVRDQAPETAQPRVWIVSIMLESSRWTSISNSFLLPVRGRFEFGPPWVRLRGRLGLLEAQKSFAAIDSVQVYPESLRSEEALAKDAADEIRLLDNLRHSRHRGAGVEFESLEEFGPYDDPRRIDWRATARHRRPMVRRYQIERHRDLVVLVDCGRLMGANVRKGTKLDCAVDAALRLLRIALRGGDRCGLGIFDDQVLGYLRPIAGAEALPMFLSSLYDLQSRWRESDFSSMFAALQVQQVKRALVIVLSDVVDAETSERYRRSLLRLAQRHVVLFAALQTPLLSELVDAPLTSIDDGFKKAVAFRILRERQQAIHQLRRGGVHVLDVEPSQLTAPLINQFIELRRSALL